MEKDEKKQKPKKEKGVLLFSGVFVTLKIVFVDLLVVCLRLSSEFSQGYSLFINPETSIYGIVTFCIIVVPGIPAAIHLLSVYRREWIWYKTILYALCTVVFYPVVPIVTLLHLLWMKPSDNTPTKEFKKAQYGATVAQAIHGCIASPLQLCYQIWLAFNGVTSFTDNVVRVRELRITDWEGNELMLSFAAPVAIFFSIIT